MPIGPNFEGACLFHININPSTILTIANESTSILKVFDNEKLLESVLGRGQFTIEISKIGKNRQK